MAAYDFFYKVSTKSHPELMSPIQSIIKILPNLDKDENQLSRTISRKCRPD